MEENNTPITSDEVKKGSAETVVDANDESSAPEIHHHHHSRHHSHHHSHHHHHHRKKSGSYRHSNKFISFLKKHKSVLINVASCTVSLVLLVLLAFNYDSIIGKNATKDAESEITQSSIKIESSIFMNEVPLVHQAILSYLDASNDQNATAVYKMYSGYNQKLNIGLPVKYTYRISALPSGILIEEATLDVSENEAFDDSKTYTFADNTESIDIFHLIPGTKYYYRLSLKLSNGRKVNTCGDFSTVASPRILSIDGIVNARDIGGWATGNGRKIKYGLLYRGSELDGSIEPSYLLTEQGLDTLISSLGVRFDMDLRAESDAKGDALGANVIHRNYGIGIYSQIFNENNNEKVRNVFADLANTDNYPIYMHCTYGRDRTGTVCYLLEALLGVSDGDLRREYEMSAFTDSYVNAEEFAVFVARIQMLEGATTQEKVEGYLLSIGVTAEEIDSIRNIFLGE